jgi:hypothetical protein
MEKVNVGRHRRNFSICAHPQIEEIEGDFISWRSPAAIATEYGLADRASVYRHAHALGLFDKSPVFLDRRVSGRIHAPSSRQKAVENSRGFWQSDGGGGIGS